MDVALAGDNEIPTEDYFTVSILVVMDVALADNIPHCPLYKETVVSILVVMDVALAAIVDVIDTGGSKRSQSLL